MPKRTILAFAMLTCLLVTKLCTADERPNIVFLFSDDQTVGAVGCYGNKDVITPNLDKLADDGVRFVNHYNTTSICMASRCCVLTGLYEHRHGCNFTHGNLEHRLIDQSYAVRLREAGYFTGFAGKIGFVLQEGGFDAIEPLFDRWAGGPGQTDYVTKKNKGIAQYADKYPHCSRAYGAWGADFLKAAKASGKPFCMSISFKAPHLPWIPDPIDMELYKDGPYTRPANWGVENGLHLSPQVHTSRAANSYREWVNEYDRAAKNYYALITGVDAAVGMIRDALKTEGLADNTVIIFTSDNGYNSGSHGFGDKVIPYEEGSKSPLIIYDPRLPKKYAGQVCSAVTANVDMAATIFALAGVPAPEGIDGKNLLPLLTNPSGKVRDHLPLFNYWGIDSAQSLAVVTPKWKYIYWYYGGEGMQPTEELFDLEADPTEMVNLSGDANHADELAKMRKMYDAEVAGIAANHIAHHGYERYGKLFDRNLAWEKKASLVIHDTKKAKKAKQPKTNPYSKPIDAPASK
ncbi:sulfatase-like hydrolase/transferase [bacterium]|nr:sulfatase-like hydrolase/transferase [bacterium]